MTSPTIASRMRRRCILMSGDGEIAGALRAALPDRWEMVVATSLAAIGGFEDILQHRFLLLDLDAAFDPLEILQELRVDLMLNVPVFCFGGTPALQDSARLARADRLFARDEIAARLPGFCEQYGWGAN